MAGKGLEKHGQRQRGNIRRRERPHKGMQLWGDDASMWRLQMLSLLAGYWMSRFRCAGEIISCRKSSQLLNHVKVACNTANVSYKRLIWVCLPNKGPCQDAAAPSCLALAPLLKGDEEEGSSHCNTLMMKWLACSAALCWEGGGKVLGHSVLDAG